MSASASAPDLESSLPRPAHYDLAATFAQLAHGPADATIAIAGRCVRRATRTPDGPAAFEVLDPGDRLVVRSWGPGAGWVGGHASALLGLDDDPDPLLALLSAAPGAAPGAAEATGVAAGPLLKDLARRFAGVRFTRTARVVEALVPAILGQKVTATEAHRAYGGLIATYGEPAPGPFGLRLQPSPERLAGTPYHAMHPFGVERRRAEVIRDVGRLAARLEEATSMPLAEARARLLAVPGVGPWTMNEVARDALGDPDAVSLGDAHIPHMVCFALAREPRGTDERMLELLAPYLGQRGRVVRLLKLAGFRAPRYGPRMAPRSIAGI